MRKLFFLINAVLFTILLGSCKRDIETMAENFRKQGDSSIDHLLSRPRFDAWLRSIARTKNGKIIYDRIDTNCSIYYGIYFDKTTNHKEINEVIKRNYAVAGVGCYEKKGVDERVIREAFFHLDKSQSIKSFFVKDDLLYILTDHKRYNILIFEL